MSDSAEQASTRDVIAKLERRVERERKARLEAERIAEDGLRSLYLANRDLDQRILDRTAELDAALETANAASRAKTAFIAHMSHHLMNPLNGVVGMLELLGDTDYEPHEAEWHASALRSARRLHHLARQLLSFVEVDGVDLRKGAPVRSLSDVLAEVEAQWHGSLVRAGQLPMFETTGLHAHWIAAPTQLTLLFFELFANVVEHAGPGPVEVTVRLDEPGRVAIDVTDAGPGVDNATQKMASALGVHDELETQADGSAALGLVLMQRIAEGLDGRIVFGAPSRSTVSVELPLEPAPAAPPESDTSQ